ncbi:LLM class flavin-dependent oxidoreductase [Pseudactinotalea terrae]|uniref:LLM class flavin-dependent oxidoreductase n=1 Tax=Pseudactinotalea terrae TaxID=1743262 RepID=UPI0012E13D7B|nr:LLM class flavin-dependent oxidoreductase [Pseudactinotalea terrae]
MSTRASHPHVSVALQSVWSPSEYGALGALVEGLGFDGLSVYGDLGFQPPIPALLAAARTTARITLGPACLNPYLTHPVEIAGQVAALDEASGGRAYLGLARGSWLQQVGVEQPRPLAHLEDTIEVVRRLLAGDVSGYHGRAFTLEPGMKLQYEPLRPEVDVLLGVWGPRGAELAGRLAQEVKLGGSANPDMVRLMRQRLDDSSIAAGRGAGTVRVAAGAVTVVDRDGDRARRLARREVAMYVDVVGQLDETVTVDPELQARLGELIREGRLDDAGALLPADLLRRFCLAGTPAEVAEQTIELFRSGADRVEYGTPHGVASGAEGIRLLGEQVLPEVRRAMERERAS